MFARTMLFLAALSLATALEAKTLRWSSQGDVATQDPHGQDESFTQSVNQMIYERLIMPGKDLAPTPWLATSWETVSPTKRVFRLRRDVRFQDGSELGISAVIWATGYRADYSWIKLPIVDADGRPRHGRGVTDARGLYFLGLTWQHTRGSALIGWVKDDAEFIAERIAEYDRSKVLPSVRTPVGASALPQARSNERT
jgi:ABC-type transport system substrate-binding protein